VFGTGGAGQAERFGLSFQRKENAAFPPPGCAKNAPFRSM
jgi:hypothetical protein